MPKKQRSIFNLQDSAFSASHSMHEAILAASNGARSGGGAFAFVTKTGAELCFKDPVLKDIVANGKFDLIVGVDQITTPEALGALETISDENRKFVVKAYLSTGNRTIFHPKFIWFKKKRGGVLVLGSGNLTLNGLRHNCEAFVVSEMDEAEMSGFLNRWELWLKEIRPQLLPINGTTVIDQAKRNYRNNVIAKKEGVIPEAPAINKVEVEKKSKSQGNFPDETTVDAEIDDWMPKDDQLVLVAEIPRSNNRWAQANFDKTSFEDFFGASIDDSSIRVLFRHVSENNTLGEIESRPSVAVSSRNYRFELGAAAGLDYPPKEAGRPIAVFIKLNTRTFLYTLCMPNLPYYNDLHNFCKSRHTGRKDRVMRIPTKVSIIKAAVPQVPLW